jgi:hypothetical protein
MKRTILNIAVLFVVVGTVSASKLKSSDGVVANKLA